MQETDLYPPLKQYLEGLGYQVKGEIGLCDLVALREGEAPLIIELKRQLNLTLLLQCIERLNSSDNVYLGVPEELTILKTRYKSVAKLLRRLGLGLISINPKTGKVTVLLDPLPYQPKVIAKRQGRLLGEFAKRVGDPLAGGSSTRRQQLTPYRRRAIALAEQLRIQGPSKAQQLAQILDDKQARQLLYKDHYGWFERIDTGIYQLSPRGARELDGWLDKLAGEDR